MEGRCQCGQVAFRTPTPKPSAVYVCHCNECRRQSSSMFGVSAIFPAFTIEAPTPDAISVYTRNTLRGRQLDCYFCARCGSRLMHKVDGEPTLSVKGGCLDGLLDVKNATHIWCREAVVDIPEGVKRFDGEPV